MKAPHLRAGRRAEQIAGRWLRRQGLTRITGNYRCKAGELDLIMLEDDCLVIVEVRYRRTRGYGGALHSVSHAKRQRIATATMHYLQSQPRFKHHALRFDVITLTGPVHNPVIEWHRRAFDADGLQASQS